MTASASKQNELELVLRVLRALADSANPDDFCKALALDVADEASLIASYIVRVETDGHLSLVGSFGFISTRIEAFGNPSIWDELGITDAIRSDQIIALDSRADYLAKYPADALVPSSGKSFVFLPIKVRGSRAGGLGLVFSKPNQELQLDPRLWEIFTATGEVFIVKGWTANQISDSQSNDVELDPEFVASRLTDRDRAILSLLAIGKTNREIAKQLSYSESTIKQAAMKIMKLFGVHSRQDAARVAEILEIPGAS